MPTRNSRRTTTSRGQQGTRSRAARSRTRRRAGQLSEKEKRRKPGTMRGVSNKRRPRTTRSTVVRGEGRQRRQRGEEARPVLRRGSDERQSPQEHFYRTTDYRQAKREQEDVFGNAYSKANTWLRELMDELSTDDKHRAHLALKAVLQTLRDRLPVDEAVHLGAQLPVLIRGIYYEGWVPAGKPIKYGKAEFVDAVRGYFMNLSGIDHGQVIRSVFQLLANHISEGEWNNIIASLPEEFADLLQVEAMV